MKDQRIKGMELAVWQLKALGSAVDSSIKGRVWDSEKGTISLLVCILLGIEYELPPAIHRRIACDSLSDQCRHREQGALN